MVTGLTNGTAYNFVIVARNQGAQGSAPSADMASATPWPYVNAQGPIRRERSPQRRPPGPAGSSWR